MVANVDVLKRTRPDAVVLIGMGGSALPGEVVNAISDELGLRHTVIIWKDYGLPHVSHHHRCPLYVFVSFSGNTEETLSGFKELLQKRGMKTKAQIAVIATGGELLRIARKKNLPYITFPAGDLTPRQATGRMFYAIGELLFAARLIIRRPHEFTHLRPAQWKRRGYELARRLNRNLIVIYTQTADHYLGYFWKIKLNETAKVPAFNNVVPEMNHNELVGFTRSPLKNTAALFLQNADMYARVSKRYAINKRLLSGYDVNALVLPIPGKTKLERTWNAILYADWTSYALAEMNNTDPRETRIIDKLKAAMKK
ncbi:MAG: hypothetical protein RL681_220 [Candidatus Parcubacteria bacterium]